MLLDAFIDVLHKLPIPRFFKNKHNSFLNVFRAKWLISKDTSDQYKLFSTLTPTTLNVTYIQYVCKVFSEYIS